MTMHEARHGLRPVTFEGVLIAESTTRVKLTEHDDWDAMSEREKKLLARWTQMALYSVPPQDDPGGLIGLPAGGYLYHIIGDSACYHTVGGCSRDTGVPVAARDTDGYLDESGGYIGPLPCWQCNPPLLWGWVPVDDDTEALRLVADPDLIINAETPDHALYRSPTAHGITKMIERDWVSRPAKTLLERATLKDPAIAAVYARPSPPRSAA